MEFLKIYDVTNKFKEISQEGKYYEKYYIQEDTHVYHIFRIIKGNYDDENDFGYADTPEDGYTIERENISKEDVLDFANIAFRNRAERDHTISNLSIDRVVRYVTGQDEQNGFSNWDFFVYDTIEECENRKVSEDYWEIIRI